MIVAITELTHAAMAPSRPRAARSLRRGMWHQTASKRTPESRSPGPAGAARPTDRREGDGGRVPPGLAGQRPDGADEVVAGKIGHRNVADDHVKPHARKASQSFLAPSGRGREGSVVRQRC